MVPRPGLAFFGQRPIVHEIENGDRILLDVLEEPGTGRKIFDTLASQPVPGFRMEAIADGPRVQFVVGDDKYDVQCSGPVVESARSSYLWVRREELTSQTAFPDLSCRSNESTEAFLAAPARSHSGSMVTNPQLGR
jgi:hypothetical protein